MTRFEKALDKILRGTSDNNVDFKDLLYVLTSLGFEERINGSHHILTKEGVEEILNLQPKGSKAKAYQVKQVRNLVVKYKLGGESDDSV